MMEKNEKWLQWAIEIQAIAQAGLWYTEGVFDKERYERLREIAVEMMEYKTEISDEKIKDLFCNETGYQTPKIDTRTAIFKDDKILLVQEMDGRWSLPGGWCDVELSVKEGAIKEVKEEAGLDVEIPLVVAVQYREKHNLPILPHKICKIFLIGEVIGGEFIPNDETKASGYFALDDLPPLTLDKNNEEQLAMCLEAYHADHWKTLVD